MRLPLVLALTALSLLAVSEPAAAAAKAKRCPAKTIAVGPKKKPRACVAKSGRLAGPQALKATMALGLRPPRRSHRNPRTLRVAQRALTALTTGGQSVAAKRSAARARPAELDPDVFGKERSVQEGPDGQFNALYERADGIEIRLQGRSDSGVLIETRDKLGAGHTLGIVKNDTVADCPKANGDVDARWDQTYTFGQATSKHGKRTWTTTSVRVEADWTGHVGVGAKAETFDIALRGEVTVRSGVEIAATGKRLKQMPTRTYRSALTKRGLKVGTKGADLASEFALRGPKGKRANPEDIQPASGLVTTSAMAVSDMTYELEQGDKRWYDARACAKLDFTWTPERVVKGGRADWDAHVLAQDGTPPVDGRWSIAGSCGTLDGPATRSGSTARFGVVDSAGAWGPNPYAGACATAEITTTAGRPRPFDHSIPPIEPTRWRYDISITFNKNMGAGIAETNATATGSVTLAPEDGFVEGTGGYSGTEWDQTPTNTCGQDMERARGFSGVATVGAEIQGDQVTIGLTANERPFDMAWIVTVPVTGGSRTITAKQPFCGEPGRAATTSVIAITATPVPAG